jgi:dsRNA-specific ribonuclease
MDEQHNPYNNNNVEITEKDVDQLLESFGVFHKIQNMDLVRRAFIHRSYVVPSCGENKLVQRPSNCLPLKRDSNERLEFLGDGVLECVTKLYLYKRFPKADEGFMTEKKICLVKNDHIGNLAHKMELFKWFIISRNAEEKKTRSNFKKLGCLFEAFLGALFLDANQMKVEDSHMLFKNAFNCGPGFQVCQLLIEAIYETLVDWNEILETDTNYKNILQVKIQKEFKRTPEYIILGQDEDMQYTMGVYLCLLDNCHLHTLNPADAVPFEKIGSFDNIRKFKHTFVFFGSGTHKIKKMAEQVACFEALSKFDKV